MRIAPLALLWRACFNSGALARGTGMHRTTRFALINVRRRRQCAAAAVAVAACVLGWSGAAAQGRVGTVRIGVLNSASRPATGHGYYGVLLGELAEAGWIEGRNLVVDWRFADGDLDRHDALAAELVALRPDLIIAGTQSGAVAVMKATATIPIVFVQAPDPVEAGLADSLSRPGRNVTGLASMNSELVAKRLEIMRDALPGCRRVAVLYQPSFSVSERQIALVEHAAKALDLHVVRVPIGAPQSFDAAFAQLVREHPDGVLVIESPSLFTHRRDIVRRMSDVRLAAMYGLQEFSLAGGLLSYSISFDDQYRRAAGYVTRILRGEKPSDLPIQQPLRFELTVNLKTVKQLGLKLPQSILLRADRIID
jgi:putative ABC transport system substrate-binding protein